MMQRKLVFWLAITLIFSLIIGCVQDKEGCLDPAATNFDVGADDPCCCTYPDWDFNFLARNDSIVFFYDSLLLNRGMDSLVIHSFDFYLSNFELRNDLGNWVAIDDSLELTDGTSTYFVKDDIVIVNRLVTSSSLGIFSQPGTFDQLRYNLGLTQPMSEAMRDSIELGHPLNQEEPLLYEQDNYLSVKVSYSYGPGLSIRDTVSIPALGNMQENTIDMYQSFPLGFDIALTLKVDYALWFDGINPLIDSKADIIQKLLFNSQNAIILDN